MNAGREPEETVTRVVSHEPFIVHGHGARPNAVGGFSSFPINVILQILKFTRIGIFWYNYKKKLNIYVYKKLGVNKSTKYLGTLV